MSNDYRHVELLTGDVRRRRWTTEQKLTIIEQSFEPGETVSSTARRHGVAPNLLYRWRRVAERPAIVMAGSTWRSSRALLYKPEIEEHGQHVEDSKGHAEKS